MWTQILLIFGVWAIWSIEERLLEVPEWLGSLIPLALGIGGQCLINPSWWWLGFGTGGAAMFVMRLADLLLVGADFVKVAVLRSQRAR